MMKTSEGCHACHANVVRLILNLHNITADTDHVVRLRGFP